MNRSQLSYKHTTLTVKKDILLSDRDATYCPERKKVTKIVLSTNVSSLPDYFFEQYPNVKEIHISKKFSSTTALERLSHCKLLETIQIQNGNKHYKIKNGVLYNHSMKKLLRYPNGKKDVEYTVPASITDISQLLCKNRFLETLTLGRNVNQAIIEENSYANTLPNLNCIRVSSANSHFASYKGVLYRNGYKCLVYVPSAMHSELTQINWKQSKLFINVYSLIQEVPLETKMNFL